MTDQEKFECIANFNDTSNTLLKCEKNNKKENNKMEVSVFENDELIISPINEIKNNEYKKYKNIIKNHPLFPVLSLQFNLCEKAMFNVNHSEPISMEPMSNVS
uniref:Uncharacterized protein n=1 Tax=Strongyloides venezuelensis TaxID=75913 RepID=A0A0K0FCP5_STRVS